MSKIFSASFLLTVGFALLGIEVRALEGLTLLAAAIAAIVMVASFEAWSYEESRAAAPTDD